MTLQFSPCIYKSISLRPKRYNISNLTRVSAPIKKRYLIKSLWLLLISRTNGEQSIWVLVASNIRLCIRSNFRKLVISKRMFFFFYHTILSFFSTSHLIGIQPGLQASWVNHASEKRSRVFALQSSTEQNQTTISLVELRRLTMDLKHEDERHDEAKFWFYFWAKTMCNDSVLVKKKCALSTTISKKLEIR